jgi:hypothetical protein
MVTKKTTKATNPVSSSGEVTFYSFSSNLDTNNKGQVIVDIDDVKLVKMKGGKHGLTAQVGPTKTTVFRFISEDVADSIRTKYKKRIQNYTSSKK